MDNFLKIKGFLYYQFLIIENYLYLWKNGTSKIDERLYYNEYNDGLLLKKDLLRRGTSKHKKKKNNSIKRASQNKVYTKLILFKALLCYLTF